MKVVPPKSTNRRIVTPPIPFERPVTKSIKKDESLSFKCHSAPHAHNPGTYELTVPFFRSGTLKEFMNFLKRLKTVFVGQAVTTRPGKFQKMRHLLQGDALAKFESWQLMQEQRPMLPLKSASRG